MAADQTPAGALPANFQPLAEVAEPVKKVDDLMKSGQKAGEEEDKVSCGAMWHFNE